MWSRGLNTAGAGQIRRKDASTDASWAERRDRQQLVYTTNTGFASGTASKHFSLHFPHQSRPNPKCLLGLLIGVGDAVPTQILLVANVVPASR